MQTPRIITLNRVLSELKDLHPDQPQCPGAEHCPTARAIADLEILIGEMTIEAQTRAPILNRALSQMEAIEATYPPMKAENIDPDTAHAILRAQGGIGQ